MRILSITAQKPNSTGSGVFLTELVKELAAKGHEQAVVAGVYKEDKTEVPEIQKYIRLFSSQRSCRFRLRECRMRCLMKARDIVI